MRVVSWLIVASSFYVLLLASLFNLLGLLLIVNGVLAEMDGRV